MPPPFASTLPGRPSRFAPPALVVRGADRRFSIISAGFGCEVGMDAWVGGCRWGVDMCLVWVRKVVFSCCVWSVAMAIKIYKLCDVQHLICVNPVNLCLKNNETQPPSILQFSCPPFGSLIQGAPLGILCLPLWCGGWQALFDYSCGLWVRSEDGCLAGVISSCCAGGVQPWL